ncbi:E3 ubiquitin-protein ligase arc-1-like isoform X2 [Eriocheir sinensis]|uniref:E3 ubiquitin-protein ligase arc-1-like isoform X2 n=1 Tax=Eriocheir sinensis TaxID=95602 RepID=UPI0021C84424|nr:E3 ubiquitin-protein ligase arc-1-like isoform X2 [Eriocheir sinensis]
MMAARDGGGAARLFGAGNRLPQEPKCPRCRVNYKLKDMNHYVSHKREPLLLSCGHAVCESCTATATHTCILCNQVTTFDKSFAPGKHLYILGGLYCNRKKEFMMNAFHQPQMFPQPKVIKKDQCQECCQIKASVLCTTCTSQLCEACFRKIHLPRTMNAHKSEPLPEGGPWTMSRCREHPGEFCSLLCHTCTSANIEKYICTRCHILGLHQQHEVIELAYLNSLKKPQVKAALTQVEQMVEELHSERQRRQCKGVKKNNQ